MSAGGRETLLTNHSLDRIEREHVSTHNAKLSGSALSIGDMASRTFGSSFGYICCAKRSGAPSAFSEMMAVFVS